MPIVLHVLITAMYTVVAATAATVLASSVLVEIRDGIAVGVAVAALCGLFHLFIVHFRRYRELSTQVARLHQMSRELFEAVADGTQFSEEENAELKRVSRVVAEVKVLQSLVERLTVLPPASSLSGAVTAAPAPLAGELNKEQILEVLREALRLDRIDVYVQPGVRLPQRKVCFYECFSRIRDASGAVILPEQFIAIAEQERLVSTVDNI